MEMGSQLVVDVRQTIGATRTRSKYECLTVHDKGLSLDLCTQNYWKLEHDQSFIHTSWLVNKPAGNIFKQKGIRAVPPKTITPNSLPLNLLEPKVS